jgi:uncharacterized protein (DUF952 family)
MQTLYHVVSEESWSTFDGEPSYEADSLRSEGFIHLSEQHQVAGVLDRYYQNVPNLLLLHIDPARLTHDLRYEAGTNGEQFPHVYGPINKDAVVEIERIGY